MLHERPATVHNMLRQNTCKSHMPSTCFDQAKPSSEKTCKIQSRRYFSFTPNYCWSHL